MLAGNQLYYTFSPIDLAWLNKYKYSGPPALESVPDMLKPPKGCAPTMAPVHLRLIYRLPTWKSRLARSIFSGELV